MKRRILSVITKSETVAFASPTKEDDSFIGWKDAEGNYISHIFVTAEDIGDIVLYAKWQAI